MAVHFVIQQLAELIEDRKPTSLATGCRCVFLQCITRQSDSPFQPHVSDPNVRGSWWLLLAWGDTDSAAAHWCASVPPLDFLHHESFWRGCDGFMRGRLLMLGGVNFAGAAITLGAVALINSKGAQAPEDA